MKYKVVKPTPIPTPPPVVEVTFTVDELRLVKDVLGAADLAKTREYYGFYSDDECHLVMNDTNEFPGLYDIWNGLDKAYKEAIRRLEIGE